MKFNGQAGLAYQLPRLENTGSFELPLTSNDLKIWLAELPILNINQLAYQLPKYVQDLNRIKHSDKDRFDMLEQLRPIVAYLYETLTKRFRGANLNLSIESQEVKWLLNVLISEMAIAYQRLLFNLAATEPSYLNQRKYSVLAQRAIYYLGEKIYLSYLISTAVTERTWLEFNATYAYTRRLELNTKKVKDKIAFFGANKGTIDTLYNRSLVLSLVSPYSLRSAELEQIYYGLLPWFSCIKLVAIVKPHNEFHLIDLKKDKGPEFKQLSAIDDDKYSIDLTGLLKKLTVWLETKKAPKSAAYKGMSEKLLTQIIANLEGQDHRGDERLDSPGEQVEVVVGLQEIDLFLGHIDALMNQQDDSSLAEINDDDQQQDKQQAVIWDDSLDGHWDELHYYSLQESVDKQQLKPSNEHHYNYEVRSHEFKINNESERGVCLSCSSLNDTGLYIGELMFIRGFDPEIWTLGIIRWMTVKNKQLEVGLYLLSAHVDQVIVSQNGLAGDMTINALWMGESENGNTILLPRADFKTGDELLLDHQGELIEVKLGDVIWHSEGFSQFCMDEQELQVEKWQSTQDFNIPAWAK